MYKIDSVQVVKVGVNGKKNYYFLICYKWQIKMKIYFRNKWQIQQMEEVHPTVQIKLTCIGILHQSNAIHYYVT